MWKVFLWNVFIKEDVYVKQTLSFEGPSEPNHVYKLNKALNGLKQAPWSWYERISNFLISESYVRGKIDTTLFTKGSKDKLLVIQVYMDDILFGSKDIKLCEDFNHLMRKEFEMSMIRELYFFLGLQIKQSKEKVSIN